MKPRTILPILYLLLFVVAASGCNELLGLDDACLSCGGAVASCTFDNTCPSDEELCEDQLDTWTAVKNCVCANCAVCTGLCGGTEQLEGCPACFRKQVEGQNANCKIESTNCRL